MRIKFNSVYNLKILNIKLNNIIKLILKGDDSFNSEDMTIYCEIAIIKEDSIICCVNELDIYSDIELKGFVSNSELYYV